MVGQLELAAQVAEQKREAMVAKEGVGPQQAVVVVVVVEHR